MTDTTDEALDALMDFMSGSGPLDGTWFGDPHPEKRGRYWWRPILRDTITALRQERDEARADADMLEEEAEKTEVQLAALRLERDGLRKRLDVYEGRRCGPLRITGMVDDMEGALTEPTYTQADLDAAVAAALEEAAMVCDDQRYNFNVLTSMPLQSSAAATAASLIRALRPDALEDRDQAMIAEGMRRAAEIAEAWRNHVVQEHHGNRFTIAFLRNVRDGIRAEAKRMERGEG